ncbi:MAG: hypothetical protein ACJAZ9_001384 [Neolewinella sp.]
MKPPDNLEKLINTTRKTPLEMDITLIDAMVRDFPKASSAPPKGGRAPKYLTTGALVAVAAFLMYSLLPQEPAPETAMLVPVPVTKIEIAPEANEPEVATIEEGQEAMLTPPAAEETVTLPKIKNVAVPVNLKVDATVAPKKASTPQAPSARINQALFGETTITGEYETDGRGDFYLYSKERVNGRKVTWALKVNLTKGEEQLLFYPGAETGYLERETGRLIVMKGKRNKGTFYFQPRASLREEYEAKGWGTMEVKTEEVKFSGMIQGVSLSKEEFTDQPAEILWLQYFTQDINDDYISAIKKGLGISSLKGLWKLVNNRISIREIQAATTLSAKVIAPFHTENSEALVGFIQKQSLLEVLDKQGYRNLSPSSWEALIATGIKKWALEKINDGREVNYTLEDIIDFHSKEINPNFIAGHHQAFARDLTPTEIKALHSASVYSSDIRLLQNNGYVNLPVADYILLHAAPKETGTTFPTTETVSIASDYPKGIKGFKIRTEKLPAFSKLILKDNIRIVVVPGEKNEAKVAKIGIKGIGVDFKVNQKGELTISRKLKFGFQVKGLTVAEIRLTASALEAIEVKLPGRILVVGTLGDYEIKGPVGKATFE